MGSVAFELIGDGFDFAVYGRQLIHGRYVSYCGLVLYGHGGNFHQLAKSRRHCHRTFKGGH